MIDWFMQGRNPKREKKEFKVDNAFRLDPTGRPKPCLRTKSKIDIDLELVSKFKGKGHPNPTDRKTPAQKAFLRKTRMGTGRSHKRFMDKDGDGVISGLDCAPRNPKKHMDIPSPEEIARYKRIHGIKNDRGFDERLERDIKEKVMDD